MLKTLFSRKWRVATILVIVAIGVQVRLACWQLERLQERRLFNARVQDQLDQPPLTLEARTPNDDLGTMEYRSVVVRGESISRKRLRCAASHGTANWARAC